MSNDQLKGTTPCLLTLPYVGFRPTIPLYAAGRHVDPPVCDPSAAVHIPVATATEDPLLDPPGVWFKFQGFSEGDGSLEANSVVTAFPIIMAPAAFNLATEVAS